MARVFVSHASEDRALAVKVHRWLIEAGHEVFLDQDLRDGIALGEEWEQRLHERLRWANTVICVVTSAYLDSTWCAIEIGIARSRGSQLLPLCAEPGVAHPLLRMVQHTDYTADPAVARAEVISALHRVDATWPEDRSPFPGLRPFDTDQHRVFFGRADEVEHLAELLRSPTERAEGAALLVVGPSGCGKSSLVRAGLLPVLADHPGWRTLSPILPDTNPVAALARELAANARRSTLDWTVEHVHHQLDKRGLTGLVDELLLADPAGPQRHLLVVVDQFEELLTQTAPIERARFAELLRPALTGPVRVVATLRPEFLDQLLVNPELAALPTRTYTLRPLRREALRAVIERPARLAGIHVDDALVDRLVDDTDSGEALPLLAFTLAQLAEGVSRGGRLSSARYDQLGRVQGALTHQADAALADAIAAAGRSREQVIAGLLRLVTIDEQGRPTRWRVHRTELPDQVVTELDAFVARRLLTTDTDNGTAVIGVSHEAFLSAWPPLAEAITNNVSALRARRAVEHAATEWHNKGRLSARLWGGGQLTATITDIGAGATPTDAAHRRRHTHWLPGHHRAMVTEHVDLTPKARDFLRASIRHDRYRRTRATTVLSVLLTLALIAVGIAVIQQREAQEQQRIAIARQLVAQAEAVLDTDPRSALQLGIAAHHLQPGGETHAGLVNLLTTRYAGALTSHAEWVRSLAFAPEGTTLATGNSDGTAILWDLTNPTQPRRVGQPLTGHTGSVRSVAFAPDGATLATGSEDGTVMLWDLTDRTQPRRLGQPLSGHTVPVFSVAFAPDGVTLAVGSGNGTVLWDLVDRTEPRLLGQPIPGHIGSVLSVAFAPDGTTLAASSAFGAVVLWDLTDRTQPRRVGQPLTSHTGSVDSVAFAPDGATLATGSSDGTAILWDLTDRTQPRPVGQPLTSHTGWVYSVAFAPDGATLATGSSEGGAILWDLTDRGQPRDVSQLRTDGDSAVSSVAFTLDGSTLAVGTNDGTVVLWDLTDRAKSRRVSLLRTDNTAPVLSVAFAPDGATLAVSSAFGAMVLWDVTDQTRPRPLGRPLKGHPDSTGSVAFAPHGATLAVGSSDGMVVLWDLTDRTQPRPLGQPLTGYGVGTMAFTPGGTTLAVSGSSFSVSLWDVTDRTQPSPLGQPLTGHTDLVLSVAFASDGKTLAVGSNDGAVLVWDVTDRTQPRRVGQPFTGHTDSVSSVAFAPDLPILATGSDDRTVILWDLSNPAWPGRLGSPLTGHTDSVSSVAFAPDGHTLATGSADGSVILWDLKGLRYLLGNAVERACSIARDGLDRDEWARRIPGLPYRDTCTA